MSFRLFGQRRLAQKVASLQRNIRRNKPLLAGGKIILRSVKNEAPVRTGTLRNNIDLFERDQRVSVGPKITGSDTGNDGKHMLYVVRGTRHMAPNPFPQRAFKKSKSRVIRKIEQEYKKLL